MAEQTKTITIGDIVAEAIRFLEEGDVMAGSRARIAAITPMGPLSTKPTDGSTPKGSLPSVEQFGPYRCKECTLFRVPQEGDTCFECSAYAPKD